MKTYWTCEPKGRWGNSTSHSFIIDYLYDLKGAQILFDLSQCNVKLENVNECF